MSPAPVKSVLFSIFALAKCYIAVGEKGSNQAHKKCDDVDQDRLFNLLWHAGQLNIYCRKRNYWAMRQLNKYLDDEDSTSLLKVQGRNSTAKLIKANPL